MNFMYIVVHRQFMPVVGFGMFLKLLLMNCLDLAVLGVSSLHT